LFVYRTSISKHSKKPRKPNVFIDDEKYAMAKVLVAQDASTMEIAKALNVSQMTAWKVRDAIVKGLPLSYRNKREARGPMVTSTDLTAAFKEEQHQQQQLRELRELQELQEQHMKQQQLEQLQQQQQQMQLIQRQQMKQQAQQQLQSLENQEQQQQQPQQQHQATNSLNNISINSNNNNNINNNNNPRKRLKAYEREVRDKEITKEILELIREDSNIQYWKVSAKLAEKGYAVSPSSVCQKLKSMGIHRRWKPGDKPPPILEMDHLKQTATTTTTNTATTNGGMLSSNNVSSADESCETQHQFEMGGGHFLSAFSR